MVIRDDDLQPEFARVVVPHGTAAVIADPHEFVQMDTAFGGRRIVDWLAQRAGGQFMPVESEKPAGDHDKDANALVREFGLLIADVMPGTTDGHGKPRAEGALAELFAADRYGKGRAVLLERWLFFAEAKHTVTLYYGQSTA